MRTQKDEVATRHLTNSREIFIHLLEVSRTLHAVKVKNLTNQRDYEELEM